MFKKLALTMVALGIPIAAQAFTPNDPYFPQQWHLPAMRVPQSWDLFQGGPVYIATIGQGFNATEPDHLGRVTQGYNVSTGVVGPQPNQFIDGDGTGGNSVKSMSLAAATMNNGFGGAGPANLALITPISNSGKKYTDADLIKAIDYIGNKTNVRLICSSMNPGYSATGLCDNSKKRAALNNKMKWFHDVKGGLIFCGTSNNQNYTLKGTELSFPMKSYVIVCVSMDDKLRKTSWANYGKCVWFGAPGSYLMRGTSDGRMAVDSGHAGSFAATLVCAVAAQVWAVNPKLTNIQVENILKASCMKPEGKATWNKFYGWGMPQADKAVQLALQSK